MHVYLNPDDLLLMAERSGFCSTRELFDHGLVIIDHGRNNAPLPRLRFREAAVKCCPFLENRLEEDGRLYGLCGLHPGSKPLVCILAPLFREVDLDAADDIWGFKPPLPGCPGCNAESKAENRYSEIADPAILDRLDSEKQFFRRLAGLLDDGASEEKIIEELYYRKVNCTH